MIFLNKLYLFKSTNVVILGRIVPAIATTTSAVAGLATIQFLQVVIKNLQQGSTINADISDYRNCFLNLALPMVLFSEPAEAEKTIIR